MSKDTHLTEAGFTLVELLIVLAMLAAVMLISIPMISEYLGTATTRSVARELLGHLQRAKMEAVKRNQNVAIVFSTAGTDNYQTYVDADADGTLDAGETVIATVEMPVNHTLTLNAELIAAANTVGFNSRGRPYWPSPWPGSDPQVVVADANTSSAFTLTAYVAGTFDLQ